MYYKMKAIEAKRRATSLHVPSSSQPLSRPSSPVNAFFGIKNEEPEEPKKVSFSEVIEEKAPTPSPEPVPTPRRGSVGGLQSLTKSLIDHDSQISTLKDMIQRQEDIIKSYEKSSKRLEKVVIQQEQIIKDLQQSLDDIING